MPLLPTPTSPSPARAFAGRTRAFDLTAQWTWKFFWMFARYITPDKIGRKTREHTFALGKWGVKGVFWGTKGIWFFAR